MATSGPTPGTLSTAGKSRLGDSVTQSIRMRFSVPTPLTFLDQQPFGYCPRAKRPRSNTRAGVVGYFFETAHHAIAPMWQPGPYIRSSKFCSVVEGAHGNVARKTKWWLELMTSKADGQARLAALPKTVVLTLRMSQGPLQPTTCSVFIRALDGRIRA